MSSRCSCFETRSCNDWTTKDGSTTRFLTGKEKRVNDKTSLIEKRERSPCHRWKLGGSWISRWIAQAELIWVIVFAGGGSVMVIYGNSRLHRYYDVPSDHWTQAWNKLSRRCSRVETLALAPSQLGCCPSPMPVNDVRNWFPCLSVKSFAREIQPFGETYPTSTLLPPPLRIKATLRSDGGGIFDSHICECLLLMDLLIVQTTTAAKK